MFRSLLIANRGEIACRIMRTAGRLGIRTVAVHSDADADALHVRLADRAIRIGEAPASASYLRAEAIVEAALRSGAEAVHPGYGFLSERAILPRLCAQAGLVFVGPSADIIETMGSKIGAKAVAHRAGVANVPGYAGEDQSTTRLCEEARRIGLPVMVKASAGGGGKGMRRVFAEADLLPALDMARREAEAAFGDPSLLLERLVQRPRHLEVQVAGDRHGNLVHLFERDCSVQRANQKLLEEAPAPNLPDPLRERLLGMGVAVAREVGYDNLGTVEFILEEGRDEPWFLEMNTRLQVEHTVTEEVTGLDLVEWQLRIAAGETLPLRQDEIRCEGAAIEARVTAERADLNFQPDAGPITRYREPAGVRVDSGIDNGSIAAPFYDSMLAKVIARGETREAARSALEVALREYDIGGPATTTAFLADALAHPDFRAARATTAFIEEAFPDGWRPADGHRDTALIAACVLAIQPDSGSATSAWRSLAGFRVLDPAGAPARSFLRLLPDGENSPSPVELVSMRDGRWRVVVDGKAREISLSVEDRRFRLREGCDTQAGSWMREGERIEIAIGRARHAFRILEGVAKGSGSNGGVSGSVTAPMPGVVAQIHVAPGDAVAAGDVVAVLESMKLFVPVKAGGAGVVARVGVKPGDSVSAGDTLVALEREDQDQTASQTTQAGGML